MRTTPAPLRDPSIARVSADRKESVHREWGAESRPQGRGGASVGQPSSPRQVGAVWASCPNAAGGAASAFTVAAPPRRAYAPGQKPKPTPMGAHLANGLRGLMGRAQATCRLKRMQATVQLTEIHDRKTGDNRLSLSGTATCKSPLCPLCVPALMRVRTEEIKHAIDVWGAERTWFATFTVRHNKRMHLMLLHRMLTLAFGNLFSGRAGQDLSRELGGPTVRTRSPFLNGEDGPPRAQKPYSIRAHDRTWSERHGWHPHLHTLLFMHGELEQDRVLELLTQRWKVSAAKAVAAMKELVHRALNEPESDDLRSRCEKTFGKRIFSKGRTLKDAATPLNKGLQAFTETAVMPLDAYGVKVERVREPGEVAKYLAKLGCELTGMGDKRGKVVNEGGRIVEHFGLWQLAGVACSHGHPFRQLARAAWGDIYRATFGTQTLTFSQGSRAAFGLDKLDDDDITQEGVMSATEEQRLLGYIEGAEWDRIKREQGHGLLATLYNAHKLGVLESLPYVEQEPLPEKAFMGRGLEPEPKAPRGDLAELLERARARGRAPPVPSVPEDKREPFELERWKQDHARMRLRWTLEAMGARSREDGPRQRAPAGASLPLTRVLLEAQRLRFRLTGAQRAPCVEQQL